ncbi:phosphomannomutase/phosphoglucomutase [Acidaminobacter sp. JC074]|uniref:phosphomannomutase/phosphoglucomutase n=1 Tax=Acidaminobacter sp. JC074 TaxID=2530199 RepID=UPI001F11175E|nr:phosphomannomutase/phosphoglucomutase [Acidaminobacter sp. JC074]MCH4887250.1 phosphomannomutase/phosphoglucomutase [Acidaminobacter sp. JC074]
MNLQFLNLQNGSDIRGIAMEGIPSEKVNLTNDHVKWIALAFGMYLSKKSGLNTEEISISVGTDSRLTGPDLQEAIVNSLSSLGITTYTCGIASTPSMFMSTKFRKHNCDGAIMITASHLPFNRNGMKFFTRGGGLDKADITELLTKAEELYQANFSSTKSGTIIDYKLIDVYADYLVHKIRKETSDIRPLEGLKIIVDAGNGAGGFFSNKVLKPLGAKTKGSQFLDPDGNFPNHIPNPEDPEAMASIQAATIEHDADLGIIFDTDVDRAAIVDRGGKIINRNNLIGLMSAIVLEDYPRTTIVTDSVTSDGLTDFIESLGGVHHRFKRGYKNVINESKRLNQEGTESVLAIETSGHGALKENFFLDDGAYTITKIIIKMAKMKTEGKQISSLIESLVEPVESKEHRIKIQTEDFKTYGDKVIEDLKAHVESLDGYSIAKVNYEGVRVNSEEANGWFLLRLSLHDPILPLNIESNKDGGVEKMETEIRNFLSNYKELSTF